MPSSRLEEFAPIFYPKSHAVIGASANGRKFGGRFLQALVNFGYPGLLYPVNSQESQVLGLTTYPRIGDIPGPVDFASVAVPARAVPEVIAECLAKGVKGVQVFSAGFREISDDGRLLVSLTLERAAKALANLTGSYRRRAEMRDTE